MPLQIRRGNTAEVNSITPLIGELIFNTQTGRVLVGDGATAGGVPIAGVSINEAKDAAAASLLAGTHKNISFSYDTVTKSLSAIVDILIHETIESDAIITGKIFNAASTVVVDVDTATVNGTLIGNVTGDVKGSVFADDSTLLVDAVDGVLRGTLVGNVTGNVLGDVTGNVTGNVLGDVKGSIFADDSTLLVDAVDGVLRGTLVGNVTGNVTGLVTGDVKGSIFADDSTLLVDAVDGVLRGTLVGNVNGALIGNVTGNVTGNVLGDVTGNVTGNVLGDVTGNVLGDVKGSIFAGDSTLLVDAVLGQIVGEVYGTVRGDISSVSDQNNYQQLILSQVDNTNLSNVMTFSKGRGSINSYSAVQNNDVIYDVLFAAHDGTGFEPAVRLRAGVGGAVSTGIVPGKLDFFISDSTGVERNVLNISSAGLFSVNGLGFLITSDDEGDSPIVCRSHFDTTTDAPNLLMQRSRGTSSAPTALQLNDKIFDLAWGGYSPNGNYNVSARIRTTVYATPSGNTVPGQMELSTRTSAGGIGTQITIDQHKVTFSVMPVLPTYAGDVAAETACGGTAVNGMMYYDSNTSTIRAYAGGSWVSL